MVLSVVMAGFFSVPVWASDDKPVDENLKYRKNGQLQVLCQEAVAHIPWDDVEYQGGLDQKGNFIVAADAGTPFSSYEYPIDIPLELDLLEKFNMNVPIGIITDAKIAGLKVYEDGHVEYNGQDISNNVGVFCKNYMVDPALLEQAGHGHGDDGHGGIEKEELGAPLEGEAH